MKTFNLNRKVARGQRGSLLFDILVGAAILSVIAVGAITITNARAAASEQSRALRTAVEEVPGALTSVYYNNLRSFSQLTANAAGKEILVNEGARQEMPWRALAAAELGGWTISTAGTNTSPNPTITMTYFCTGSRSPARTCRALFNSIVDIAALDDDDVSGNHDLTGATDYNRDPNFNPAIDAQLMITGATVTIDEADETTSGSNVVTVTYGRPI